MKNSKMRKNKRHLKIKSKLKVNTQPKLVVFRSNLHIYGSIVDAQGKTLFSSSDAKVKKTLSKTEKAFEVGKLLAEGALKKKIKEINFDRAGYLFHGRVKALAEGARTGGLKF